MIHKRIKIKKIIEVQNSKISTCECAPFPNVPTFADKHDLFPMLCNKQLYARNFKLAFKNKTKITPFKARGMDFMKCNLVFIASESRNQTSSYQSATMKLPKPTDKALISMVDFVDKKLPIRLIMHLVVSLRI